MTPQFRVVPVRRGGGSLVGCWLDVAVVLLVVWAFALVVVVGLGL